MLFIPIDYLQPGMVLAKDVCVEIGKASLITQGQVLSSFAISRLQNLNVNGAYIESEISNDIEVKEPTNPKLKKDILSGIKNVYADFNSKSVITNTNIRDIAQMASKLVMNVLSKDEVMLNMIELKGYDDYTYHHSYSVALLSILISIKLEFSTKMLIEIATAAFLHDIGKTSIPKEILNKPSSLTDKEYEIMKQHPDNAFAELSKKACLSTLELEGIYSHHEKYNGTGYPRHLEGEGIPLYGRILAIADVYDAITSNRPYREAYFPNEAIEFMMSGAETHFDYAILLEFLKTVEAYPVGTIVSLSNGETAIVVKNNSHSVLRPLVRVINQEGKSAGEDVDLLLQENFSITIVGMGDASKIKLIC